MTHIDKKRSFGSKMKLLSLGLVALMFTASIHATKLKKQNLTQLITQSESIISGVVKNVSDGFSEKGIPYTEITISVGSVAKGSVEEESEYTFRQFGLLKPRSNGKGKVYLGAQIEGFAKWRQGEMVVAFMYKPASLTGLQTTVGLTQGKFTVLNGSLSNDFGNAGLFEDVYVNPALLDEEQANMMNNPANVELAPFMKLVGDAVEGKWIEKGDMK